MATGAKKPRLSGAVFRSTEGVFKHLGAMYGAKYAVSSELCVYRRLQNGRQIDSVVTEIVTANRVTVMEIVTVEGCPHVGDTLGMMDTTTWS